jgi:hypothetical protein
MRARLVLLGGQAIALGLMMAFLVVPASSLFLAEYGAEKLPFAYMAVAASGVALSGVMARAQRRLSLSRLALTLLASFAAVVTVAWLLLLAADATWVTFLLLVMFPLSIPFGFLIIGAHAGRLLDLQQMKAYFPRVVAGFSVGFAIGGLIAAWIVRVVGDPRHLLAFDVGATALFIGLVMEIGRRYPQQLRSEPHPTPVTSDGAASGGLLLRSRVVRMVFAYQVLSAAVTQLLDFMVWERAAARYPDVSDLAAFLGVFGAIINVVSIAFVALLAGWLLSRFGIGLGLSSNPAAVIVVLACCLVAGYFGGPASLSFFVLVCAAQVTDIAFTDGTTRTSINATYQVLRPAERLRAQTSVEAAGVPLALGLVGALLVIFNILDLDVRILALGTAAISVVWLIFAFLGYRAYGRNLRASFARRDWDPVALLVDDDASRAVLDRLVNSDDIRDVRLAVDVLADAESPRLAVHAIRLLSEPNADRRLLGIKAAALLGDRSLGPQVLEVVRDGSAPSQLRALAVSVATGLGADTAVIESTMSDPDVNVRLAAAAATAQSEGGPAEHARSLCMAALLDQDAAIVEAGLTAVARAPHHSFTDALLVLAGHTNPPPALPEALAVHVRYANMDAARLLDLGASNPQAAARVIDALGQSRDESLYPLLTELLLSDHRDIAVTACRSVVEAGTPVAAATAADLTASETARAVRAAAAAKALARWGSAEHLVRALDDEIRECARRVLDVLGLAHGTAWLERAVGQLESSVDGERGLAIETLEVELAHRTSGFALALLDPTLDATQRRDRLARTSDAQNRSPEEWLAEFLDDPSGFWQDRWLLVCALHATAKLPEQAAERARQHRNSPDPVASETARWLLNPAKA